MLLSSKQIIDSNFIKLSPYSKQTQAGVDLSVNKIEKIIEAYGIPFSEYDITSKILKNKTIIPKKIYSELEPKASFYNENEELVNGWFLRQGIYSVTFNEGINVPLDCQAKVTHRSLIYRIGNIIESPWWDAGFACEKMNTTLVVNTQMLVEVNARLAQVVFYRLEQKVNEGYDGQWQNLSAATR